VRPHAPAKSQHTLRLLLLLAAATRCRCCCLLLATPSYVLTATTQPTATNRSQAAPGVARGASPAHDAHPDPDKVCYAAFRWPAQLGGEDIRVSGAR
jgi:hypothetical protein